MKLAKKLCAAVGLAVALSVVPVATAGADPGASQACIELENLGLDISHGQCVSLVQTTINNGNAGPVGNCKFFDAIDVLADFPFGQCVKVFRQFF